MSSSSSHPPSMMQAIVGHDFGQPASAHLQIAEFKTPVINDPDDVLIKVIAGGLNPVDAKIVGGQKSNILVLEKPVYRIGLDISGIVIAVGGGVTKFIPGDQVYARVAHNKIGGLSMYTITPQSTLALKPKRLSFDEAAGVPLAALTALQGLRDIAHIKAGDKVLILGGTGGVGIFAIQIAKVLGASEIVVTCGPDGISLVQSLGATQVINYRTEKFSDLVHNMDICFDGTGEANAAMNTLRKGGIIVSLLAAPTVSGFERSGIELNISTKALISAASAPILAQAILHGITYEYIFMKPSGDELAELANWIDNQSIKPIIDRIYPFIEYKEAFDYLEQGRSKGKLVIHIQDEK